MNMAKDQIKKSPTELLEYQTELLEKILENQKIQIYNANSDKPYLKSVNEHTIKQTGYLKSINTTTTIFGLLLIIGICLSLCGVINFVLEFGSNFPY
jgi:phosphate starvation-inducible protein PhoH